MIDLYTKHELLGGNAMNSRERVHAVLNHQLPDRVPNGLGGCETAGLHRIDDRRGSLVRQPARDGDGKKSFTGD